MKRIFSLSLLLCGTLACFHATAQDFKSHIDYLASEACAGRLIQTKGDTLAANYILGQLKTIEGVTLLGDNGSQDFTFGGTRATVADSTFLTVNGKKIAYGQQYVVLPISECGTFQGETVYLDSLTASFIKGKDLKGKMVVIDQEVKEDRSFNRLLFQNFRTLGEAGVTGLIFISEALNSTFTSTRAMSPNAICMNVNKKLGEQLKKGATVKITAVVRPTTNGQRTGRNLVAKIAANPANNPNNECIVIGAHYDHLGIRATENGEQMYPGADDNASGTATIIELARYIAPLRHVMKKNVYIIAFGCEELGLVGSNYYANNPIEPLDNAKAMLNFDMMGRMNDYQLNIEAFDSWDLWPGFVAQLPNKDRLNLIWLNRSPGGTDHVGFTAKGIPALSFFTGLHPDYHKPTDTADKINYQGMKYAFDYVVNVVDRLILLNY